MVSNQTEFNNKFPKENKQIEIEYEDYKERSLTIKDYLELKKLDLREIDNIEKLVLSNLPNLQEVIIWDCGVKELIIENCPDIETLNLRSNSLTNLNFLDDLEKLEELEISRNNQLSEFLKPYEDSQQKIKQKNLKDFKKIYQLTKQNKSFELIKEFGQSNQNREDLKKQIAALLKDKEKFTAISQPIITKELIVSLNKEFTEKEAQINYLELRAQELTEANKQQKDKIFQALSHLLPEKELIKQLIILNLEFTRYKKQSTETEDYYEKCDEYISAIQEIKKQLRSKLNKEIVKDTMNKVQAILTECDELVRDEIELEGKLNNKSALITSQKQNTQSTEERKIIEKNSQIHRKQLEELENIKIMLKEIKSTVQPQDLISKLINQLTHLNSSSENEEQLITKLRKLIAIKQMFLNNREQLLNNLRDCCDLLEKANLNKYARIEEVAKLISATGKLVSKWTAVNIVEPFGDSYSVLNSRNKRKFAIKSSDIFQSFLKQEDQSLSEFKQVYLNLVDSLPSREKETEPSLFTLRYKIYEIATNIWKKKAHLEVADMKDAISALQTNYLDLQAELKTEEQTLERFSKQLVENSQALVLQTL